MIIRPVNTPEAERRSFKFVNELGVPFFVESNNETRLVTFSEARFLLVVLNLLYATLIVCNKKSDNDVSHMIQS